MSGRMGLAVGSVLQGARATGLREGFRICPPLKSRPPLATIYGDAAPRWRITGAARSLTTRPIRTYARNPQASAASQQALGDFARRSFHSSAKRSDIFFATFPALKSGLLNVTRVSLVFLPFVFRYKLWKKYRRTAWLLIQIPIFAVCIVFALGLDQSPRTGRWRLLLMSEGEEIAWSRRKDILKSDGILILPSTDPRSQRVSKITTRLVTALEEHDHHVVSGASWPPRSQELGRVISEREAYEAERTGRDARYERQFKPSGTARSTFMPFRPASSNPLKQLEAADWNIYVIDSPAINAFCLPSKDVFVYTGLLDTLPDDDAMLAAVLGHEIAHVMERHSVENLGFLNVAAVAFDVLRGISFALTISFPFITDSAGLFINYLNDVVAERAFSRKLEEEADCVGLSLMATAGYDPRASLDLWELMKCVEEDAVNLGKSVNAENKFGFLRTHPTSDERLQALEKDMPGAMRLWRSHLPERVRVRMKREEKEEKDKGDKGDKGAIEASEEGRKERDAGDLKVVASADRAATQAQAQVDTRKHADTVVSPSDQERQV